MSIFTRASLKRSPVITACFLRRRGIFLTTPVSLLIFFSKSISSPSGIFSANCVSRLSSSPGETDCGSSAATDASSSTSLNSSCAVLPIISTALFGSFTPGSCTTISFSPCRSIVGSETPNWSILLRIVSRA